MDPIYSVKEEYLDLGGSYSSSWQVSDPPRPIEGLNEIGPPAFLVKLFDMVDDLSSDGVVSWSRGGRSFVVWDPRTFSSIVLPRYFKHNNFSSFVRQLNTYGFKKVDPEKWEFANEAFLKGQKHLIRNIRRRKGTSSQPTTGQSNMPCFDMERLGQDSSRIDRLRREKEVLMLEILKLRQQQQNARTYLQQMDLRLKGKEKKQQEMMNFLSRVVSNPDFIHQLSSQVNGVNIRVKAEMMDYGSEVSELEALALEIQGFRQGKREFEKQREELEWLGSYERELDEGFWEELLSEGFDDNNEDNKEEHSGGLAEGTGFFSSKCN